MYQKYGKNEIDIRKKCFDFDKWQYSLLTTKNNP